MGCVCWTSGHVGCRWLVMVRLTNWLERFLIKTIQMLPFRMCDRNGGRRLRQWLIEQIDSGMYSGLIWENDEKTMFRIPWKHAGKQDYNQEVDASIFKVWRICLTSMLQMSNLFIFLSSLVVETFYTFIKANNNFSSHNSWGFCKSFWGCIFTIWSMGLSSILRT